MEVFWIFPILVSIFVIVAFKSAMPIDIDDAEMKKHEKFVQAMSRSQG